MNLSGFLKYVKISLLHIPSFQNI